MITRLIVQIGAGILGIWLATQFVPGVEFIGPVKSLLIAGTILGLINFFIKPILKVITLPLRILILGLFSLVINMGMIWVVDILFVELVITGLIPLFWTTIIVWGLSLFLGAYWPEKK
jgi:putative membrane protein